MTYAEMLNMVATSFGPNGKLITKMPGAILMICNVCRKQVVFSAEQRRQARENLDNWSGIAYCPSHGSSAQWTGSWPGTLVKLTGTHPVESK